MACQTTCDNSYPMAAAVNPSGPPNVPLCSMELGELLRMHIGEPIKVLSVLAAGQVYS